MTPAEAIGMLDRQIARHGQSLELRRIVASQPDLTQAARGFVRGYKPDEIGGGIIQGDSLVVVSPSTIAGTAFEASPPDRLDQVFTTGRLRNVESAELVYMQDVLVRINLPRCVDDDIDAHRVY